MDKHTENANKVVETLFPWKNASEKSDLTKQINSRAVFLTNKNILKSTADVWLGAIPGVVSGGPIAATTVAFTSLLHFLVAKKMKNVYDNLGAAYKPLHYNLFVNKKILYPLHMVESMQKGDVFSNIAMSHETIHLLQNHFALDKFGAMATEPPAYFLALAMYSNKLKKEDFDSLKECEREVYGKYTQERFEKLLKVESISPGTIGVMSRAMFHAGVPYEPLMQLFEAKFHENAALISSGVNNKKVRDDLFKSVSAIARQNMSKIFEKKAFPFGIKKRMVSEKELKKIGISPALQNSNRAVEARLNMVFYGINGKEKFVKNTK